MRDETVGAVDFKSRRCAPARVGAPARRGGTAQRCAIEPLEARVLLADLRFAVIGDYGSGTQAEADVANLVKGWNPAFVVTTGDNNYPDGAQATIDANVGQFYQQFIYPYVGSYGPGAADHANHFWPSLGNHDWTTNNAQAYFDYFTLPNNERYYDVTQGNVELFVIDSEPQEADGTAANSIQANWLQSELAKPTAQWKLVIFHEPPYSSGPIGPNLTMRWPFQQWGATAVLNGHEHDYERLLENGFPYIIDGLGGEDIGGPFGTIDPGSQVRYRGDFGAMLVDASDTALNFQFITRTGLVIDNYTIPAPPTLPAPWKQQDIGSVGLAGSASAASGTWTIKGSGAAIGGTADAFHYVYQPMVGDGTIVARVSSVQNTNASANAGVMIRQGLGANSTFAEMGLLAGGNATMLYRTTTGGSAASKTLNGPKVPYWVKLVRAGSTFTGYVSSDGSSWNLVGSTTIAMATTVYVGLCVTAHKSNVLCTSVLDNVTAPASIAGRYVFYNHSYWNNPANGFTDDNAIDTSKTALPAGQTASFVNYTGSSMGINGVMVDVMNLPMNANLTAADFSFKVGNDNNPSGWVAAPAPANMIVRRGAGIGGSDRVELIWADNAIQDDWLQVTVDADTATALPSPDVFYFGNSIGETGDSTSDTYVNSGDFIGVRDHPANFTNRASPSNPYDFNHDSLVDGTDLIITRDAANTFLTALKLISPPVGTSAPASSFVVRASAPSAPIGISTPTTSAAIVTSTMFWSSTKVKKKPWEETLPAADFGELGRVEPRGSLS